MKKNFLLLTVALLCAVVQGAWAESVTFNVRSWDATTKQVVTTATTKDCTVLTGSHSDDWLGLGGGDDQDYYYVAKGNVSYLTLNCFGRVHLILADGATLTCTGGIKVEESNNNAHLFIYSQSNGDQEGKLIVTNSYEETAGIGSSIRNHSGTIEIHGGNLDVTGGKYGAGIGAGKCYGTMATKAGTISVFGGTIKAQGGLRGAGIGGGAGGQSSDGEDSFSDGANFFLYGGTVTATGGELAAGVGGGGGVSKDNWLPDIIANGGGGGKCHIYGGNLTAQGGRRGAGIGGGNKYESGELHRINDGEVNIEGGTVTATGGDYGAGIGGGCNCTGGTVNISGGNITAKGGTDGAGIGGGESGRCQAVTISGGYVRAEGTSYGAGIGGGEDAHGGTVTITGGTVIAIAGGDCTGSDDKGGSAIGCGQGVNSKDASENRGSLSIPDDYMVTGGDAEDNIERVFTTVEREGACIWRNYVKIEPCQHTTPTEGSDLTEAVSYTNVNKNKHTMQCRYCTYTEEQPHDFVDNSQTCVCGQRYANTLAEVSLNDAQDNTTTLTSNNGKVVNVTLDGRTLYKDGSWNTLCLPFDVADIYDTPLASLEGVIVKTLSSSDYDGTTKTLTLNFGEATSSLKAGVPYIIKWNTTGDPINRPRFEGVAISNTLTPVTTDYVDFVGSFSPVSLTGGDRSVLYLGADNKLYYPSSDKTVNSCRAVFRLKGITAGDPSLSAGVRGIMLNFDDETTGIQEVIGVNEVGEVSDDSWYSLDGRRLSGRPTGKGLYIVNGKKMIIK